MMQAAVVTLIAILAGLPVMIATPIVSAFSLVLSGAAIGFALIMIPLIIINVLFFALIAAILIVIAYFVALPFVLVGIFAFGFALAQSTESFKRFQGAMTIVVDKMITALEPLFESMLWMVGIFDVFAAILIPFFESMASSMEGLIGETFFNVIKGLLVGFALLAYGAGVLVNMFWEMVAATAKVLGASDDEVESILENKVNIGKLSGAVREAIDLTYEQANAIGESNAALYDESLLKDEIKSRHAPQFLLTCARHIINHPHHATRLNLKYSHIGIHTRHTT
jgi:hypothetical protein